MTEVALRTFSIALIYESFNVRHCVVLVRTAPSRVRDSSKYKENGSTGSAAKCVSRCGHVAVCCREGEAACLSLARPRRNNAALTLTSLTQLDDTQQLYH